MRTAASLLRSHVYQTRTRMYRRTRRRLEERERGSNRATDCFKSYPLTQPTPKQQDGKGREKQRGTEKQGHTQRRNANTHLEASRRSAAALSAALAPPPSTPAASSAPPPLSFIARAVVALRRVKLQQRRLLSLSWAVAKEFGPSLKARRESPTSGRTKGIVCRGGGGGGE